jgi:hypothetical protein
MPVAEGFRTWVQFPPPPPMQPGRTALWAFDEIEDLEDGLGLVIGLSHLRPNWDQPGRSQHAPELCPRHRVRTSGLHRAGAKPLAFQAPAGLMSRKVLVLQHVPYLREGYYFHAFRPRRRSFGHRSKKSICAASRRSCCRLTSLFASLPTGREWAPSTRVRRRSSATTAS